MRTSDIPHLPRYFDRYINLVGAEVDLLEGLHIGLDQQIDLARFRTIGDHAYAPGKWTVKGVIQHITDTERIMSYRSLRFARGDTTTLPGFDEDLFGAHTNVAARTFDEVVAEFATVRAASISLFASFDWVALLRRGPCADSEIEPLSLGFVIIGHQQHHAEVLLERYAGLA